MACVFVTIMEDGDRVRINASGISGGMRYSVPLARLRIERRGPLGLEELLSVACEELGSYMDWTIAAHGASSGEGHRHAGDA